MAFGGPALGPLISAFIEHGAGWHILVAFVPETHGPTLLKWRLEREGNTPAPLTFRKIITVFRVALARPVLYLFTEPVVMLVSIYFSVLYGILYGFFEAFTVVYLEIRHFQTTSYVLTYIALGLGFVAAYCLLCDTQKTAADKGMSTPPEARLTLTYFGADHLPHDIFRSLFLFAWTAPFRHVHWIAPCIAEFLFSLSTMLIFTGFVPYLVDCYQMTAASALAAGLASRALVGSVFPLFTLQMRDLLLAGIACLLAPIPSFSASKHIGGD
ncbi:hypothetical protein R3P38DRAFT_2845480 [Favolaschia claudopus]|uniref:Uncharacterized protein n=1 Tax=Favolaschia claudopus TaxID=2862362 RepID=A0AAW0DT30_9AGAR